MRHKITDFLEIKDSASLPQSSVFLRLHSTGKWSAFYCNKHIIDLHPAGGTRKWDWCPTAKIPPLGEGWGWWFQLRLNAEGIHSFYPTTHHRPCRSPLPPPRFSCHYQLFSSVLLQKEEKSQLQDPEHTVRHAMNAPVWKIRPASWELYQRERKMLPEKTFILPLVSIKRNCLQYPVPIKSRCY